MEKEVIIAEKPNSAKKIASAIAQYKNTKIEKIRYKQKVPIYIIKDKEKEIYVIPSVGHIFTLTTPIKNSYPVFEVYWKPTFELDKKARYTKEYHEALKKYGKDASAYIVATDFDIEGETIGYNILKYIYNREDAERMKFSTLLKNDLVKAYINRLSSIQKGTALAGITRHILDFYYGINLSRGLMESLRKQGKREILSIGRVQGPTLSILVEREKQIQEFKPKDYWAIEGIIENNIKIRYIEDKIFEKDKADAIWEKIKDAKEGQITEIKKTTQKLYRPHPYNLTDLQSDAYSFYGFSPQKTLDIAQRLYEKALISYPRTSSQKYPPNLPLKPILLKLKSLREYKQYIDEVLSKKQLIANNGKKEDEAHPAIYPTGDLGEIKNLEKDEKRVYDLIVRRFIATLHEDAERESLKGIINIKEYPFKFELYKTIKQGWLKIYKGIIKLEDNKIPEIKKEDILRILSLDRVKRKTQPPKRYSPATLIRELEKRKLGTKATRAMIIETLYKRGYIKGNKKIEVTPLGIKIYEIMKKFAPQILSEELTQEVEKKLEEIEKNKVDNKGIIEKVKKILMEVCNNIKNEEEIIGKEILNANIESKKILDCPKCGGKLQIKEYRKGKQKKRFLGCSSYPECKEAYPLPQKGIISYTNKKCPLCGYPILKVKNKKITYEFCLNPSCKENFLHKFKKRESE